MPKDLQAMPLTASEREEALRMGQLYLEGESVKHLARKARLSQAKTLLRIIAVNGAETMKDKKVKLLKRQHRQHCRCHRPHHVVHLTADEIALASRICRCYLDGISIKEMATEYGKAKDRVALMAAVGYGLKKANTPEFKALRARHRIALQERKTIDF